MRSYPDYLEYALLGMAQGIPGSYTLITKWQGLKIIRKAHVLSALPTICYFLSEMQNREGA